MVKESFFRGVQSTSPAGPLALKNRGGFPIIFRARGDRRGCRRPETQNQRQRQLQAAAKKEVVFPFLNYVYTRLVDFEIDNHFTCRTARTLEEASQLVEASFEYVTDIDGVKLFRKRK